MPTRTENTKRNLELSGNPPLVQHEVSVSEWTKGEGKIADLGYDLPVVTATRWFIEKIGMPRLFDWIVGIASIVLGVSSFLYSKQIETYQIGQYAGWFTTMRLLWIAGGIGLLMSDFYLKTDRAYELLNRFFRGVLIIVFGVAAVFFYLAGDFDGLLLFGLFALVISIKFLFDMGSATIYMFYIHGFLVGIAAMAALVASGLGNNTLLPLKAIDGYLPVVFLAIFFYIFLCWWVYVRNRQFLRYLLAFSGLFLIVVAFYYAYISFWSRAFFVLTIGSLGLLLPFWEEFKLTYQSDRTVVFKMYGTILLLFLLSISYVGVIQNILLNDAKAKEVDKTAYAAILVDSEIDRSISSMKGLTGNTIFTDAVAKNDNQTLIAFTKAVFQNNPDFASIIVADNKGIILAAYPFGSAQEGQDISARRFFTATRDSKATYVSNTVEPFSNLLTNNAVVAIPLLDVNGNVLNIVAGSLNLDSLNDRLQQIATPTLSEYLMVIDGNSNSLVKPANVTPINQITGSNNIFMETPILGGTRIGYDSMGVYSMASFHKLLNANWTVAAIHPYASAFVGNQIGLVVVLLIAVAFTLIILISFFFSRRTVNRQLERNR